MHKLLFIICFLPLLLLSQETDYKQIQKPLPPIKEGAWSVVIIPDTQVYTTLKKGREGNIKVLDGVFGWIAANKDSRNIKTVVHVGDMTSKNQPEEWEKIRACYKRLDGSLPYVLCIGNHDEKPILRNALINDYFKIPQNSKNEGFYQGTFEEKKLQNAYYTFEQNGQKFLFLALEFGVRNKVLEWASKIIENHKDHRVFITTHEYLSEKSRLLPQNKGRAIPEESDKESYLKKFFRVRNEINFGVDLKKKLIDKYPNIEFLVNGHYGCQKVDSSGELVYDKQELATAHTTTERNSALNFHAMLFNGQWIRSGGDGWVLLMEFSPDNKSVQVRTYSPYLKAYRTGSEYQYSLERNSLEKIRN